MAEAIHPFDNTECATGTCYDLSEKWNFRCSPSSEAIQKYVSKVQKLYTGIGWLITKDEMKIIAGLYTFVARFLVDGTHASNDV